MTSEAPEPAPAAADPAPAAPALGLADELAREALKSRLFGVAARPAVMGRYRVLGVIASGGMGTVLEARDDALGRTVAIKVVRGDALGSSAEARARLRREARAMAALSHPHLVQVYDTGSVGEDVYIAMEYVQGETLRSWLARPAVERAPSERRRLVLSRFIAAGRGLEAMHGIGLVHRDFKPDNVLIGDDGRVRLADLGLARGGEAEPESSPSASAAGPDLGSLTRTGVLSGTPAYMAPEQLSGAAVDARADLFSFCVSLYEALYGVRPYVGSNVDELRRAMRAGEIDPGEGSGVPQWLRAVILSGLALDPSARPATMSALLGALERDPDLARLQSRRSLARGAALALAVGALFLLGREASAWWTQRRSERDAAERVATIEASVAELRARGQQTEARALLEEQLARPELAGTRALAAAWLREAKDRAARASSGEGDGQDAALSAYAAAWLEAHGDEQQADALLGIAQELHRQRRSQDLRRLLARLGREHPALLAAPTLRQIRLDTALATRDLPTALTLPLPEGEGRLEIAATLAALGQGTPTPYRSSASAALVPVSLGVDGAPAQLLTVSGGGAARVEVLTGPPGTPPLRAQPWTWGVAYGVRSIHGPTPFVVSSTDGFAVLLQVAPDGRVEERARWAEAGMVLCAAAADLDGDGADEIYVGVGDGSRDIMQLLPGPADRWAPRPVGADVTLSSDVQALLPADLEGDGAPELAAGLGPWSAYDVRVLDLDRDTGRLRTRARLKLGSVVSLSLLQAAGGGPPLLVAGKSQDYPSVRVFPADRPYGGPAGATMLRLRDHALEPVDFVPAFDGRFERFLVVDVNGDGREDLVEDAHDSLTVHLSVAAGGHVALPLGAVNLIGTLQADADAAVELVVDVREATSASAASRLWVLGAGGEQPAPWTPARWAALTQEPSDPARSSALQRARALADMGLLRQAAEAYEKLSVAMTSDDQRALARLWAGTLLEEVGEVDRATALFIDASTVSRWAADALEGALRGAPDAEQLGRVWALAEAAAADPTLDPGPRARLVRLAKTSRQQLDAAQVIELDGGDALPAGWRVDDPLAVGRQRGALHLRSYGAGPLLRAEADYTGGPLSLELDATFRRLEWSSGLELRLVGPDGRVWLSLPVRALGGGGQVDHYIAAQAWGVGPAWASAVDPLVLEAGTPVRYTLRCAISQTPARAGCTIQREGNLVAAHFDAVQLGELTPGRLRLELRALGEASSACEAQLHRIRGTGIALSPGEPDASPAAGPSAVSRVDPLLRAGALDLGRALLRPLLAQGEVDPQLARALRRSPELYLPVLGSVSRDGLYRVVVEAFALSRRMHPKDRWIDDEIARALVGLDAWLLDVEKQDEPSRAAARELLRWRAGLRERGADLAGAQADLERALALDRGLPPSAVPDGGPRAWILLDLAELALRSGDEQAAVARLADARREAASPELVEDLIDARPGLGALDGAPDAGAP